MLELAHSMMSGILTFCITDQSNYPLSITFMVHRIEPEYKLQVNPIRFRHKTIFSVEFWN